MTTTPTLPVQARGWHTRERILDAAVTCLGEEGYSAATTSRIQALAGVSRGSLLHHFPSRDALLIAAVQRLLEARTDDLGIEAAESIDHAIEKVWATFDSPLFRATVQLWAAAQNDAELAAALAPREHEFGAVIRRSMRRLFGSEVAGHPRFAEFIAILLTSMRGAALTYAFEDRDHRTDPHLALWKSLAATWLD